MALTYLGDTVRAVEPLLVRPRIAWRLLGCGNTHGYELLNKGELESFRDGRSRNITVASIHRYIARRLGGGFETAATTTGQRRAARGKPK